MLKFGIGYICLRVFGDCWVLVVSGIVSQDVSHNANLAYYIFPYLEYSAFLFLVDIFLIYAMLLLNGLLSFFRCVYLRANYLSG